MSRLIREMLLILVIAAVPAGASALWHPKRPNLGGDASNAVAPFRKPGEVTLAEVQTWPADNILWLDARPPEVFDHDHVPSALRLNEDEWESLLPDVLDVWRPGVKVVVYCDDHKCDASHGVAERLCKELGWEDVHVLHGGWFAWRESRNDDDGGQP